MKKIILLCLLTGIIAGCTQTENGLVWGTPDYEKRDITVSQQDIDILTKTIEILEHRSSWSKDSLRDCSASKTYSLYCALEAATKAVLGQYIHRQPALQEVRFVIDDNYKNRWNIHRLADFNAHPDTSFTDIKFVLNQALETARGKLHRQNNESS